MDKEKRAHEHFDWPSVDDLERQSVARFAAEAKSKAHTKASDQVAFEDAYSEIKISKGRTPFCLMTINPKPEITFAELEQTLINACDVYFVWYVYSFEIRSKPDQGLHCHVLAQIKEKKQNRNFSQIKDYFYPVMCGNKKHIDVRYVKSDELEKVFEYIQKTRVAKSKKSAVEATLSWREENGIDPYYSVGDLPTCLVPPTQDLISLN